MPPDATPDLIDSIARSAMLTTIGARIDHLGAGEVRLSMPMSPAIRQQHGFAHAGSLATLMDSACGYAALSLAGPGASVLTTEFKINLLAPGVGDVFVADAKVVKAGRTLTVATAECHAETVAGRKLVAIMTATLMVMDRADLKG